VADEPREQRIGARHGLQQAALDGVLQTHRGGRAAAVDGEQRLARQLEQRRRFTHARIAAMRHAIQRRHETHEFARPGDRDAALPALRLREHFRRAAQYQETGGCRLALGEQPRAAGQLEHLRATDKLPDLLGIEAFEERQQRQVGPPVERRALRALHRRQRIAGGRLLAHQPVFLRRVLAHLRVQRAQPLGEGPRDRALHLERARIAACHERAEVVPPDEPAVHVRLRHHRRGAHTALDERHLAEHRAGGERRNAQHAAAGQAHLRLGFAVADEERAACGLSLPHQPRALAERYCTRHREQRRKRRLLQRVGGHSAHECTLASP